MRTPARLVALALLAGAVALAPAAPAAASSAGPRDDLRPVGADPVEPGFPMLGVGVAFDLPPGVAAASILDEPEIRFRRGGDWGAWEHLEAEHADEGLWSSALTAAAGADAYQVRGLPEVAQDARAYAVAVGPVDVATVGALATAASTGCMTREQWGAAPPRGSLADGPSSARLRVLTVHHTADTASSRTSVQWVRAIQGWHQNGNGWDDIGYQVLIDPSGVVIEGRWSGRTSRSCASGGTAAAFGFLGDTSSSVVTGAHVGGWNTGNLGVSMLGTFTGGLPTTAARDALVAHLADVTARHGIDPLGTVTLTSSSSMTRTVPTIIGHRDLGATACPGDALYAHLPTVRERVAAVEPPDPDPGVDPLPAIALVSPTSATATLLAPTEDGMAVAFEATLAAPHDGVTWRWNDARGRRVASAPGFERTLAPGTHRFTVIASDGAGQSVRETVQVTVVPERLTDLPRRASARPGRASGRVRSLAEGSTGMLLQERRFGRRAAATSALEARFAFRVRGGSEVDLVLDAVVPEGAEAFRVEHSLDGGRTFEALGTLAPGDSGRRTFALPSSLSGGYLVRIVDADRAPSDRVPDSLRLLHLGVHARNVVP